MKFRVVALCVFVAVIGGVTAASPSAAAPAVEWNDPAGDAKALPGMESSPRPSDAEIDILKVGVSTKGQNISASMRLQRIDFAPGSQGSAYRFYFSFENQRYYFEALMGARDYVTVFGAAPGFYREGRGDAPDEQLKCACANSFDWKGGSVTFTVNRDAVARALGSGPASFVVTDLEGRSLRTTYEKFESDIARAPKGTTLRV